LKTAKEPFGGSMDERIARYNALCICVLPLPKAVHEFLTRYIT
jgi:hypothetical protein